MNVSLFNLCVLLLPAVEIIKIYLLWKKLYFTFYTSSYRLETQQMTKILFHLLLKINKHEKTKFQSSVTGYMEMKKNCNLVFGSVFSTYWFCQFFVGMFEDQLYQWRILFTRQRKQNLFLFLQTALDWRQMRS